MGLFEEKFFDLGRLPGDLLLLRNLGVLLFVFLLNAMLAVFGTVFLFVFSICLIFFCLSVMCFLLLTRVIILLPSVLSTLTMHRKRLTETIRATKKQTTTVTRMEKLMTVLSGCAPSQSVLFCWSALLRYLPHRASTSCLLTRGKVSPGQRRKSSRAKLSRLTVNVLEAMNRSSRLASVDLSKR